jgi:hypothetical protein
MKRAPEDDGLAEYSGIRENLESGVVITESGDGIGLGC